MQLSMFDTDILGQKNTINNNSGFDSPNRYCSLCPEVWLIRDTWMTVCCGSCRQLCYDTTRQYISQAFLTNFLKFFEKIFSSIIIRQNAPKRARKYYI